MRKVCRAGINFRHQKQGIEIESRTFPCRAFTFCVAVLTLWQGALSASGFDPAVTKFVSKYCSSCHNSKQQKGDRSFEDFLETPSDADQHETLEEILDLINLGEMPPDQKGVRRPGDTERRNIVAAITRYLREVDASNVADGTVLRRLARHEYNNAMRDMLGVHPDQSDATQLFPVDQRHHGFVNIGSAQTLSDYQLRLYMKSARFYLNQTLVFSQPRPETKTWTFRPADFNGRPNDVGTVRYQVWAPDRSYLDIGHGEPVDNYPTYPSRFAERGTPHDGLYRIRVKANAVGRKNPYDPTIFRTDLTIPLKMGLWHVPNAEFLNRGASEGRVLVDVFDLPDAEPAEFEVTVWMPAGSTPFVHWINGVGSSKPILERIVKRYHPEAKRKTQTEVDRLRELGLKVPKDALVQKVFISDLYQGPRIRIYEMTLEGPLVDQWPPRGHKRLVGDVTNAADVDLSNAIKNLATLAFRRPVEPAELRHYVAYAQEKIANGTPHEEAIKTVFTSILCSPRFLFLDEGNTDLDGHLDDYELASRLSFTLWSAPPDTILLRLAANATLKNPEVLQSQVDRLLKDPRSEAFNTNFTDAWLRLDKIGSMPPSNAQYPAYYRERLESAMKNETRLFFRDILDNNRPVTDFIDGDYTYVNDSLAQHYGLNGDFNEQFQRVSLQPTDRRNGLLGHASVLTATANGVETSPVVRGVWVLETLLGTPPSPPPPDVPPIEPDTRGAITIREQLAKHRSVAACADCHAKIDPWGFALEFYDPIGGLRTHYPVFHGSGRVATRSDGKPVDGSGELPSGEIIQNEFDLKKLLVEKQDQFTRNLIHKLLTYATDRDVTFRDHEEVESILEHVAIQGYGMRDLVVAVIASEAFKRR